MVTETLPIKGELHIKVVDEQGNVKVDKTLPNLVVTTGKEFLAAAIGSTTSITFGYMAVGTSTTAAAISQTALGAEVARVASTPSVVSNVVTFSGVFGAGTGTGTLGEAGLFSASSNGTMFSRALIGPTTKAANDTMTITWTVTVG